MFGLRLSPSAVTAASRTSLSLLLQLQVARTSSSWALISGLVSFASAFSTSGSAIASGSPASVFAAARRTASLDGELQSGDCAAERAAHHVVVDDVVGVVRQLVARRR